MIESTLALQERHSRFGPPRLLLTDGELIKWRFWYQGLDPSIIGQERTNDYVRTFRHQLLQDYIGAGLHRSTSAVYAVIDRDRIVAAGSVEISNSEHWNTHAPCGFTYARIDNGVTIPRYTGLGLNTQITRARINWAHQKGLSCVETTIDPRNYASIKAKLKAGFVIDSIAKYVGVLFPLSAEIKQYRGIHEDVSYSTDTIPVTNLPLVQNRLQTHFAILDEDNSDGQETFYLRMIPRKFGRSREM